MTTTEWYARYYYIMRNKTSGKKYIGQTKLSLDTYRGSGKKWIAHCIKHGGYSVDNIEVLWYKWFKNKGDAEIFLEQFSNNNKNYWMNENTKWLNLIPETTDNVISPMSNKESVERMKQTKLEININGKTNAQISAEKMAEKRLNTITKDGIKLSKQIAIKAAKTMEPQRKEINEKISLSKQRILDSGLTVAQEAAIKAAKTMEPRRKEINEKLSEAKQRMLSNGLTSAQQGALNGAKIRKTEDWKKKNSYECEYCKKICGPANYKRWHSDNCKHKSLRRKQTN